MQTIEREREKFLSNVGPSGLCRVAELYTKGMQSCYTHTVSQTPADYISCFISQNSICVLIQSDIPFRIFSLLSFHFMGDACLKHMIC